MKFTVEVGHRGEWQTKVFARWIAARVEMALEDIPGEWIVRVREHERENENGKAQRVGADDRPPQ